MPPIRTIDQITRCNYNVLTLRRASFANRDRYKTMQNAIEESTQILINVPSSIIVYMDGCRTLSFACQSSLCMCVEGEEDETRKLYTYLRMVSLRVESFIFVTFTIVSVEQKKMI